MHEWSLVRTLLARADAEARRHGAVSVRRLEVAVGELAGVEPALLDSAYALFRAGTSCAGATLAIRSVAASWVCPRCAAPLPRGGPLRCAPCNAPARLAGGAEITLERVELEVPDV